MKFYANRTTVQYLIELSQANIRIISYIFPTKSNKGAMQLVLLLVPYQSIPILCTVLHCKLYYTVDLLVTDPCSVS